MRGAASQFYVGYERRFPTTDVAAGEVRPRQRGLDFSGEALSIDRRPPSPRWNANPPIRFRLSRTRPDAHPAAMIRSALGRLVASLTPPREEPPRPISTRTLIPQKPVTPALASLAELRAPRLVEGPRFLQDPAGTWQIEATFGLACGQLRICVDHAMLSGEPPRWGARQRLTVATRSGVAKGETVAIDLACPGGEATGSWRWCAAGETADTPIVGPAGRGRVAFLPEGGSEHYVYFVVVTDQEGDRPILVGEHLFQYRDAWEVEAPLASPPRWRGR